MHDMFIIHIGLNYFSHINKDYFKKIFVKFSFF